MNPEERTSAALVRGPLLDAEVAYHVMGWKVWKHPKGTYGPELFSPEDEKWLQREGYTPVPPPWELVDTSSARYSDDIGHAWPVVLRLREMGWWLSLTYQTGAIRPFGQPAWIAAFRYVGEEPLEDAFVAAASQHEAEAICLAALEVAKRFALRRDGAEAS